MLNLLAEYFKAIFNARLKDGSLQLKREEQIRCSARNEMRQELKDRYKQKVHAYAHHQRRGNQADHAYRREHEAHHDRCHEDGHFKYFKKDEKRGGTHKTNPKGQAKKPCHVHGPEAKHSYDECHRNPKNRANKNNNNKFVASRKREHEVHYHDDRGRGSSDGSTEDPTCSPAESKGELSENFSAEGGSQENYHLESYHIPKKLKAGFLVGERHIIRDSKNPEPENLQTKMVSEMASPLIDLNFEDIFPNDAVMNSFASDEEGLSCENADAFEFGI
jgi:hypothetical protein